METEYGILKMEVSYDLEQELKQLLDIEEEMLYAEVEYLPNNVKRLTMKIPPHKGGAIKDFILRSISRLKKENLN